MPVKAISLDEVPFHRAKRISAIKKTKDWIETLQTIRSDQFEAIKVEFAPETLALATLAPDRFRRMLIQELKVMGRRDLNVKFRGKSAATGAPILYVTRNVVINGQAILGNTTKARSPQTKTRRDDESSD